MPTAERRLQCGERQHDGGEPRPRHQQQRQHDKRGHVDEVLSNAASRTAACPSPRNRIAAAPNHDCQQEGRQTKSALRRGTVVPARHRQAADASSLELFRCRARRSAGWQRRSPLASPSPRRCGGPSWRPWAEKPNWWNTPSECGSVRRRDLDGMRASMPGPGAHDAGLAHRREQFHTVRTLVRAWSSRARCSSRRDRARR